MQWAAAPGGVSLNYRPGATWPHTEAPYFQRVLIQSSPDSDELVHSTRGKAHGRKHSGVVTVF